MKNKEKSVVVIQDWGIVHADNYDAYTAPECIQYRLTGKVYDHPRIADGEIVTTSIITRLDPDTDTAETLNTIYKLGAKSKDYELHLQGYNSEV